MINQLSPPEAAAVIELLPNDIAIGIFDKPELDFGAEIIEALPRRGTRLTLLSGMSADVAADMVQQLEEPARSEILAALDEATRATITALLSYPENTAGA